MPRPPIAIAVPASSPMTRPPISAAAPTIMNVMPRLCVRVMRCGAGLGAVVVAGANATLATAIDGPATARAGTGFDAGVVSARFTDGASGEDVVVGNCADAVAAMNSGARNVSVRRMITPGVESTGAMTGSTSQ